MLQLKSLDLFRCKKHIERISETIAHHRTNSDGTIKEILNDADKIAKELDIEIVLPRLTLQQQYRSNQPSSNAAEYWKRSILIPYLDSLATSLNTRFPNENSPAFSLLSIHPANMLAKTVDEMKTICTELANFYEIEHLQHEIEIWYELWKGKNLSAVELKNIQICELYEEAKDFFPSVKHALQIALAQPCTTCTIERSFSTLRRVKTWLRSTMGEDRLNGNTFIHLFH